MEFVVHFAGVKQAEMHRRYQTQTTRLQRTGLQHNRAGTGNTAFRAAKSGLNIGKEFVFPIVDFSLKTARFDIGISQSCTSQLAVFCFQWQQNVFQAFAFGCLTEYLRPVGFSNPIDFRFDGTHGSRPMFQAFDIICPRNTHFTVIIENRRLFHW